MAGFELLIETIRDFLWPISPSWLFQKRNDGVPSFAFLVHPRVLPDVYKKFPSFRVLSPRQLKWFLRHFWPIVVSEVGGLKSQKTGEPIKGWIVTIPLTAEQMVHDREKAVKFIRRGIKLAYCKGANAIGLGALNASITYRGRELRDLIERLNIGITTGVGYTAFNITDIALALMSRFKLDHKTVLFGVVGAAGAIGSITTSYLVAHGVTNFVLIDLDRKHGRINELARKLKVNFPNVNFHITSQLSELKRCRIIITATNTPDALVKNEHLSAGSIVIDDAQPSDIDSEVIEKREDVLVIEGGVIEARGIDPHVSFGLKHKTDVFSCLAEVMVLAAFHRHHEQKFDYATLEDIKEIGRQGKILGFRRSEFQNFMRTYHEKDLDHFYESYIKSK